MTGRHHPTAPTADRPPVKAPRRRRSWRRRLLFGAVLLALLAALTEGLGWLGFWLLEGLPYDGAANAARRQAAAADLDAEQQQRVAARGDHGAIDYVVHPFMGYAAAPTPGIVVNRFGFLDPDPPIQQRSEDRAVIAVLGGSVAASFANDSAAFLDALRRSDHPAAARFRGRELTLVCLAIAGFKQPQQVMALNYCLANGAEFDLVINLDGFNELAVSRRWNYQRGIHPSYPRGWDTFAGQLPDLQQQRAIGAVVFLREGRRDWARAFSGPLLSRSVTAQLVWRARDRVLEDDLLEALQAAEVQAGAPSTAVTGPGIDGIAPGDVLPEMAALWRRCSLQLADVCRGRGIQYVHCLQPNQYVPDSKPMGAAERATAINPDSPLRESVVVGYPLLVREAEALRAAGVQFVDLRRVFADVEAPVYIDDACHLNRHGNEVMGRAIAAAVLRGREQRRLVDIRAATGTSGAGGDLRVAVTGRYDDGSERDLSSAHFGTTYESSAPDVVAVGQHGELMARSLGDAVVTVHNGDLQATTTVRTGPVLHVGAGRPGLGGIAPRLVCSTTPAPGARDLVMELTRCRGGASGAIFVRLGFTPAGGMTGGFHLPPDVTGYAFAADGDPDVAGDGAASLRCPIPPEPALLGVVASIQALAYDAGSPIGVVASNAVTFVVR